MGIKVHIYSYIPIKVMASKHSKLHQSLKKDKHKKHNFKESNLYIYCSIIQCTTLHFLITKIPRVYIHRYMNKYRQR